jgi:hypothetical protein
LGSRWERKKLQLIQQGAWQSQVCQDGSCSCKLCNPGKGFFLQLVIESMNDVNSQSDSHGMSYARKSMIRCGLSLDNFGIWHEEQLFLRLQALIEKHRNHFEGEPIPAISTRN